MTTFVDAFDAAGRARTDNNPGNGDTWMLTPPGTTPLVLSPTKYLPVGNVDDEKISLPGAGWQTWVNDWLNRSNIVDIDNFMPALTDAMLTHNPTATTCDICDVYALHATDGRAATATSQSAADRAIRQDICRKESDVRGFLSEAAVPPLPIDAITCKPCGFGQASPNGACVTCGSNQIV